MLDKAIPEGKVIIPTFEPEIPSDEDNDNNNDDGKEYISNTGEEN